MLDKVAMKKLTLPRQPCCPKVEALVPNALLRQTEAAKALDNKFNEQMSEIHTKGRLYASILDF